MTNINVIRGSERYEFVESVLGQPHMTVFKDGKTIALWYMEETDKKVLEEMEKEMVNGKVWKNIKDKNG